MHVRIKRWVLRIFHIALHSWKQKHLRAQILLNLLKFYLRNIFSLLWFIAINAWCWRADCEILIHDGVNISEYLRIFHIALHSWKQKHLRAQFLLNLLKFYLRDNFSLLWFIAINAWCWRADCEILIHDGVNISEYLRIFHIALHGWKQKHLRAQILLTLLKFYIRNNFSLLWFIAINAWCWRADCEILIHNGEAVMN